MRVLNLEIHQPLHQGKRYVISLEKIDKVLFKCRRSERKKRTTAKKEQAEKMAQLKKAKKAKTSKK